MLVIESQARPKRPEDALPPGPPPPPGPGTPDDVVAEPFEPATDEDFSEESGWPVPEAGAPAEYKIKPLTDFTFLPRAPIPEAMPENPAVLLGDEIPMPVSTLENANQNLSVREMIFYSLNNDTPLRIKYTTLDGMIRSERTIHPDYVYWAGTNRHILVAWDEMNNDWRAFAVDNIEKALLMGEAA